MKVLKYIIFVLLGLLVLFLLLGMINPVVEYGHEVKVDKPLEESWGVHQDSTKFGEWLEGFKSIELLSGNYGEPGSTYKIIVSPGGGQPDFEMIETVLSIKAFDHVTSRFDSEMMVFDQTTRFKSEDGATMISTESKVKGNGMMMRSMFAAMEMFGGSFQAQEEKNIEALKSVIEANSTEYFETPEPAENVIDSIKTEM